MSYQRQKMKGENRVDEVPQLNTRRYQFDIPNQPNLLFPILIKIIFVPEIVGMKCLRIATPSLPHLRSLLFHSSLSSSLPKHSSFSLNQSSRTRDVTTMASSKSTPFEIILGSSSKARKQILSEMGYEFTVMTADIDEKAIRKEKPEELVMALAEAKADGIISMLQSTDFPQKNAESTLLITADTAEAIKSRLHSAENKEKDKKSTLLITADQVVIYEGMIREKPSNKEEAREYIKGYSGGHAATVGSVLVTNLKTGTRKGGWDRVEIYFHDIPDELIDKLIEEGAVLHVAGALIIEHPSVLPLIKEVVGTTDSVMGLPKALTEKLMQEAL